MNLADDLRELRTLAANRDRAKGEFDSLDGELRRRRQELHDQMNELGVTSIKVDGVQYVAPEPTIFGKVQDKSVFLRWALEHRPELLEQEVRQGLVNELAREFVDNEQPMPPGLGWYPRPTVRITGPGEDVPE